MLILMEERICTLVSQLLSLPADVVVEELLLEKQGPGILTGLNPTDQMLPRLFATIH